MMHQFAQLSLNTLRRGCDKWKQHRPANAQAKDDPTAAASTAEQDVETTQEIARICAASPRPTAIAQTFNQGTLCCCILGRTWEQLGGNTWGQSEGDES